jgi:hypothetical protein
MDRRCDPDLAGLVDALVLPTSGMSSTPADPAVPVTLFDLCQGPRDDFAFFQCKTQNRDMSCNFSLT